MEGTGFHWIVQQCLEQGIEPSMFLGRTLVVRQGNVERRFVVTRDMVVDAKLDVDFTREIVKTPGESHVEARIDLTHFAPDFFGHCDLWHLGHDTLTVKDTKYGRVDVPVLYPDGSLNWQMSLYALGIIELLSRSVHPLRTPTFVRLVITQPRSIQPGPRIKYHTVETVKILALEAIVQQAVHNVLHDPKFLMGDWCKYCPALGLCPPSRDETRALVPILGSVGDMTATDAARILSRKSLLEKIVKEAERVASETLLRGGVVPGFKLVTTRKHRAWRDEDAAADAAAGVPGAFKVVSPSQMEKLPGGAAIVDRYATIPPGDPAVAPASDKRPPYVPRSADEIFKVTSEN